MRIVKGRNINVLPSHNPEIGNHQSRHRSQKYGISRDESQEILTGLQNLPRNLYPTTISLQNETSITIFRTTHHTPTSNQATNDTTPFQIDPPRKQSRQIISSTDTVGSDVGPDLSDTPSRTSKESCCSIVPLIDHVKR
jgi:hypothetical protein